MNKKFRELSEAWSFLSNETTRKKYDFLRDEALGYRSGGIDWRGGMDAATAETNKRVMENVVTDVRQAAMDSTRARRGMTIVDKYRSNKWQRMSLDEKKKNRNLPPPHKVNMRGLSRLALGGIVVYSIYAGYKTVKSL